MVSKWFVRAVALSFVLVLAVPLVPVQADINGDGLDDLGAFAVEVTGPARGPQYQIHTGAGTLLADKFLGVNTTGHSFLSPSTGELSITYSVISTGVQRLERRVAGGGLAAKTTVSNDSFGSHKMFDIEWDGAGERETGFCKAKVSSGISFYQIYRRTGGVITKLFSKAISGGAWTTLDCLAGDVTGDGQQEIIQIFRRDADGAFGYQVFNMAGTRLVKKWVAASGTYQKAFLGDFSVAGGAWTGVEIAIGYLRPSGTAKFSVYNEAGTRLIAKALTTASWVSQQWETMPDGTGRDDVFLGYTNASTGVGKYIIWNPVTNTKVAGKTMTTGAWNIVEWIVGNFDGNAANGYEPGLGRIRISDSVIGFHVRNRAGSVVLSSKTALTAAYVNPQFEAIIAVVAGNHSVWIGAAKVAGRPIIKLYNANGGALELSMNILSSDVV